MISQGAPITINAQGTTKPVEELSEGDCVFDVTSESEREIWKIRKRTFDGYALVRDTSLNTIQVFTDSKAEADFSVFSNTEIRISRTSSDYVGHFSAFGQYQNFYQLCFLDPISLKIGTILYNIERTGAVYLQSANPTLRAFEGASFIGERHPF